MAGRKRNVSWLSAFNFDSYPAKRRKTAQKAQLGRGRNEEIYRFIDPEIPLPRSPVETTIDLPVALIQSCEMADKGSASWILALDFDSYLDEECKTPQKTQLERERNEEIYRFIDPAIPLPSSPLQTTIDFPATLVQFCEMADRKGSASWISALDFDSYPAEECKTAQKTQLEMELDEEIYRFIDPAIQLPSSPLETTIDFPALVQFCEMVDRKGTAPWISALDFDSYPAEECKTAQKTQLEREWSEEIYEFVSPTISLPGSPVETWQSFASSTDEQASQTTETQDDQDSHWQGTQRVQEILKEYLDYYLPVNHFHIDPATMAWAIS
ncbi:hypothetical protein V8E54_012524 [Elaphomyces granulatus]